MFMIFDHVVFIRNRISFDVDHGSVELDHARLGLIFDHASLMLKCWILIVLS